MNDPSRPVPGLIIAAPSSGSGKTTISLALMRALRRSGLRIAPAKIGPDYIDPGFHAAACGHPSLNLDLWGMRAETRAALIDQLHFESDLILAEGVMGLYDGAADGRGSSADLAEETGWPILLVVDVKGQAATAAAVVRGLVTHRDDLRFAGILFNRVGGRRHADMLRRAVAETGLGVPVLGCLPRVEGLTLESRHLGLVQARERADLEVLLERAADWMVDNADLDAILTAAAAGSRVEFDAPVPIPPLGQRIAVARDAAFDFVYPHILQGWRTAGSEILPFSPLADEAPSDIADAVYLPGGYPELHAGRIAANGTFLTGLQRKARGGSAIFAECGGYMVLGRTLRDADGTTHAMAGLLPVETDFSLRRLHLGYRRAETVADGAPWPKGTRLSAHEFHYATTLHEDPDAPPLFHAHDALGEDKGRQGLSIGRVSGSFLHLIDRGR
ncbi:MAG: cobyrinate a,c-diamide synthase [Pseudomonadota bacterium]|nr:cobyrinate a,c-diamide synthase [Pseudomonadota bacterium]